MFKEFRQFLLRGNVVDLAVGVVIGSAFGSVVSSFVKDLITPLIAAIGGQPNFSALKFTLNHSTFAYGDFVNAVVSFIVIAAVIFFFIVKPVNALMRRVKKPDEPRTLTITCPECLSEIPLGARKCKYCTSPIPSQAQKAKVSS